MQATLTSEMGGLRNELQEVKARIRAQLQANGEAITAQHAAGDPATREALGAALAGGSGGGGAGSRGRSVAAP